MHAAALPTTDLGQGSKWHRWPSTLAFEVARGFRVQPTDPRCHCWHRIWASAQTLRCLFDGPVNSVSCVILQRHRSGLR
jgi:hypothetical protein